MLKFTPNLASFYSLRADFYDNGEPRIQYGDDRTYWEDMVGRWGHFSGLIITPLHPLPDQESRLTALNNIEAENKENYPADCTLFVQYGVILEDAEDGCPFLQPLAEEYKESTLNYFREQKRQHLKTERIKKASAPINNVQVSRVEDRENVKDAIANWDILRKNSDGTKNWVMADNSVSPLSLADLQAVHDNYARRIDECFAAYEEAVLATHQAQTVADILAVELGGPL